MLVLVRPEVMEIRPANGEARGLIGEGLAHVRRQGVGTARNAQRTITAKPVPSGAPCGVPVIAVNDPAAGPPKKMPAIQPVLASKTSSASLNFSVEYRKPPLRPTPTPASCWTKT